MNATHLIDLFDKYALRLFNAAVLVGLGAVAVAVVAQ
jgi:hypothetical protein